MSWRAPARWRWLLLALVALGILLASSDVLYRRALAQAPTFSFDACRKVWGHRGLAAAGGENSLRSVQAAFEGGAAGVEIDVLFDTELEDFFVSHDRPYALFDGKPLRLETVLSRHADAGFFWLDAKDLRKLSPMAAHKATTRLATLVKRYQLTGKALVESSNPVYLSWLAAKGVYTSYAVRPNTRKYGALVSSLNAAALKLAYAFAGAGAISMDASRYTPVTAAAFGPAAVLLSTVNDPEEVQRLSAIPEVKVILSDMDHYAINACAAGAVPRK